MKWFEDFWYNWSWILALLGLVICIIAPIIGYKILIYWVLQ